MFIEAEAESTFVAELAGHLAGPELVSYRAPELSLLFDSPLSLY